MHRACRTLRARGRRSLATFLSSPRTHIYIAPSILSTDIEVRIHLADHRRLTKSDCRIRLSALKKQKGKERYGASADTKWLNMDIDDVIHVCVLNDTPRLLIPPSTMGAQ